MRKFFIIALIALATSVQAQFVGFRASTANQIYYGLQNATITAYNFDPTGTIGTSGETIEVANGDFYIGPSGTTYTYTFTEGNVNTLAYASISGSLQQSRNLIHWNEDGTEVYTANFAENAYGYQSVTTAYDQSSSKTSLGQMFDLTGYETDGRGFAYNRDGTKFWMLGVVRSKIYEYDLVPAYTGATSVTLIDSLDISSQDNLPAGMDLSPDEQYIIYGNRGDDSIDSWKLSTAGTVADGATFDYKLDLDAFCTTIYQVKYSEDGHYVYFWDTSEDLVKQVDINNNFGFGKSVKMARSATAPSPREIQALGAWERNTATNAVVTDSHSGTWAIETTSTNATWGRAELHVEVENGVTYDWSVWAKRGAQGTLQKFTSWTGFVTSPNTTINSTTYTEYSGSVTANITGLALIRIYGVSGAGAIGDSVIFDDFTFVRQ